jgi:hypothetical protein
LAYRRACGEATLPPETPDITVIWGAAIADRTLMRIPIPVKSRLGDCEYIINDGLGGYPKVPPNFRLKFPFARLSLLFAMRGDSKPFGVESRKSAVRGLLAAARFPSPLVKPDVPFSSIRLSDRLHHQLTEVFATKRRSTPSFPNTTRSENWAVPSEGTLWRRRRNTRTR